MNAILPQCALSLRRPDPCVIAAPPVLPAYRRFSQGQAVSAWGGPCGVPNDLALETGGSQRLGDAFPRRSTHIAPWIVGRPAAIVNEKMEELGYSGIWLDAVYGGPYTKARSYGS